MNGRINLTQLRRDLELDPDLKNSYHHDGILALVDTAEAAIDLHARRYGDHASMERLRETLARFEIEAFA